MKVSLRKLAEHFGVEVIHQSEGSVTDPIAFLEQVRVLQGEEGYVVRFHNGHMLKAKAEDYLRLHNMVDLLQLEKNVLELVLSGSLDDAKALMDDDSRHRVDAYLEAVERGIAATAARLEEYAAKARDAVGDDKKRLALEWINIDAVQRRDRGVLFGILAGRNAVTLITDYISKNISSGPKVDEVREIFGGVRWEDFRDTTVVVED